MLTMVMVIFWNSNITGSVFVTNAETGEEIWRRNAPSGTSIQTGTPRKFTESTTGSIGGAFHAPYNVNDMLVLNLGSALSGTTASFDMTVRYR